ncbi:MAG: HD domain-containing protein [Patescibacteria group bacterium]
METEKLTKFFSEILMLKRVKHSGVAIAGVDNPDSVAEHSLAAAQIAYILGFLEGADPEKCAVICLFHDNNETRIGDHNKVSARYLETENAERKAEMEHFSLLPDELSQKILFLLNEKYNRNTKEGIIAQDADWLEVAIQAKVYVETGHKGCESWIKNVEEALETDSAKNILKEIIANPDFTNSWWQGLKKMTYEKLKK